MQCKHKVLGKASHEKDSSYRDNATTLMPHDTPKSSTLVIPELPNRENSMLHFFKENFNACELNITLNHYFRAEDLAELVVDKRYGNIAQAICTIITFVYTFKYNHQIAGA
jgi:hypothetical protein